MPDHKERIAYLLARYVNKSCSREELEELFSYIGKDEHRHSLEELLEETWQGDHSVPEIDYEGVWQQIMPEQAPSRRKVFPMRRLAVAASVLLLAGIAVWTIYSRKPAGTQPVARQETPAVIVPGSSKATLTLGDGSVVTLDSTGNQVIRSGIQQKNGQLLYAAGQGDAVHYNKLNTPRGGQFRIVLPDGTKVWLNSASTLRYPTAFTASTRQVELEGQGYFEVAPAAAQPFIVQAGGMKIEVLGTGFDVMAYADENTVNTTLVTGRVQVTGNNTRQLLQPGQQAVMNTETKTMTVQAADVKKVTAWKNGLFVFNNMALPAILREVSRWYDVEIVYTVKPGEDLYGGGISRNLQLGDVLKLLEGNGYNHFRLEGRKLIVLP
ncbi:MAG TPA: FecR domain-containing protein [Chitinophaga sp.]|nr:FecR domain-containing protein [Chitinophaga sp.]